MTVWDPLPIKGFSRSDAAVLVVVKDSPLTKISGTLVTCVKRKQSCSRMISMAPKFWESANNGSAVRQSVASSRVGGESPDDCSDNHVTRRILSLGLLSIMCIEALDDTDPSTFINNLMIR